MALTTFSDLVTEVRERVKKDFLRARTSCTQNAEGEKRKEERASHPRSQDEVPLAEGGTGASAYADAVVVYLAMTVSRQANRTCTISFWDNTRQNIQQAFGRQALPMTWDFCESNPFSESTATGLGSSNSCQVFGKGSCSSPAWIYLSAGCPAADYLIR